MMARRRRTRSFSTRALAWLIAATFALLVTGCWKDTINDSPSIRWWLFSNFGASRMCPEMLKRGSVPLRLSPGGNVIGRFYPASCRAEVNDQTKTLAVHFTGTGYAWTPVAGRMGFSADASIEYRPDFYLAEESMYVWAKYNRTLVAPKFAIATIENRALQIANQTPLGYLTSTFGTQIVESQLAAGFTVVRTDEGDDFAVGILMPPQKPLAPFKVEKGDRLVYANETTEIRANQVDFLGPFEVADSDQALFIRMKVQGPAVDVMVFPRGTADLWRDGLQRGTTLGPPPQPPLMGFPLQANTDLRRKIPLPRGEYIIVVDNSPAVGVVAPPWSPLAMAGANAAVLSYTAALGDSDDQY